MKLVTAGEMARIEREADEGGHPYAAMMRRAGAATAREALLRCDGPFVVLCGPGNNGGDGLVAAARLHDTGRQVRALTWGRGEADALLAELRSRGVPLLRLDSLDEEGADTVLGTLGVWLHRAGAAIDALLGTGVDRPLEGVPAAVLERLAAAEEGVHRPLVVAVDLPTGVHADTGAVDPRTVPADLTVTFGFPKLGQLLFPGAATVGELVVDDIGIPRRLATGALEMSTDVDAAALLPPRARTGHKGSFGRVLALAGSGRYVGAAHFAATGAFRAGAGLVALALPASRVPALAGLVPEATFVPLGEGPIAPGDEDRSGLAEALGASDAVLAGPGLDRDEAAASRLDALLDALAAAGAARADGAGPGLVLDADALGLLAASPALRARLPAGSVLTPHPGEMARLLGARRGRPVSAADVQARRVAVAREEAEASGCVVLLKGAHTVIAAPDGRISIVPIATSALGTAGTGDILAGVIAALRAAGLPPFEAALLGAHVHGRAGELAGAARGERSAMARDVLEALPAAFQLLETIAADEQSPSAGTRR